MRVGEGEGERVRVESEGGIVPGPEGQACLVAMGLMRRIRVAVDEKDMLVSRCPQYRLLEQCTCSRMHMHTCMHTSSPRAVYLLEDACMHVCTCRHACMCMHACMHVERRTQVQIDRLEPCDVRAAV